MYPMAFISDRWKESRLILLKRHLSLKVLKQGKIAQKYPCSHGKSFVVLLVITAAAAAVIIQIVLQREPKKGKQGQVGNHA